MSSGPRSLLEHSGPTELELDFNGVVSTPQTFNNCDDYRLDLRFVALSAPGDVCVTAYAEDAHGVKAWSEPVFSGPGLGLCVSTPVEPGAPVTLTAGGATPGEQVFFVFGAELGNTVCPPVLGGMCLELLAPGIIGGHRRCRT